MFFDSVKNNIKDMTNPEIKQWRSFLEKRGYSKDGAAAATEHIMEMDPKIKQDFIRWSNSGVLPELVIEGFDLPGLMSSLGMTEVSAFITLDWLLKDPEAAKQALSAPMDKIVVSQTVIDELEQIDKTEGEHFGDKEKV